MQNSQSCTTVQRTSKQSMVWSWFYCISIILLSNFIESIKCSGNAAEWKLVDEAKFGHLLSNQRVRRKMEKIKQLTREATNVTASPQKTSDEVLSLREAIETMRSDIEVI